MTSKSIPKQDITQPTLFAAVALSLCLGLILVCYICNMCYTYLARATSLRVSRLQRLAKR